MHESLKSDIKALIKKHRLKIIKKHEYSENDESESFSYFVIQKGGQFIQIDLDELMSEILNQEVIVRCY